MHIVQKSAGFYRRLTIAGLASRELSEPDFVVNGNCKKILYTKIFLVIGFSKPHLQVVDCSKDTLNPQHHMFHTLFDVCSLLGYYLY